MDNMLGILGIARKAGLVEAGEEPVGAAARAGKAQAVFLASDAADNTVRRAATFADIGGVESVSLPFTKEEIGSAIGKSVTAVFTITDAGMAASFVKKLAASEPEKYAQLRELLEEKAERTLRRRRESAAGKRTGSGRRRKNI